MKISQYKIALPASASQQYKPDAQASESHQYKPDAPASEPRHGLTLIEIMIALTMTLIVLGAMMTAFQYASEKMQGGRAVMELANRARSAESQLRSDLNGVTVEPRPYAQTTTPQGYFEYVEGPFRDATTTLAAFAATVPNVNGYLGDIDDVLGMTVRARGKSFRGRIAKITPGTPTLIGTARIIESPISEVVWFTTWNDLDGNASTINYAESVSIRRRQLLIAAPAIAQMLSLIPPNDPEYPDYPILVRDGSQNDVILFFQNNDISARVVATSANRFNVVANSLNDLAVRKNRFAHLPDGFDPTNDPDVHGFPNALDRILLNNYTSSDDIVLTDVTGFDLRIYSPTASVNFDVNLVVEPGDVGYVSPGSPIPPDTKRGSFVDLGHFGGGWFSGNASIKSQCSYPNTILIPGGIENVYDTWTPAYESDGFNQDRNGNVDEGTDGLDNDNANGVDDTAERETLPPYPHPIRGLSASIRLIEKGTKQVHQTTIVHSFVPE